MTNKTFAFLAHDFRLLFAFYRFSCFFFFKKETKQKGKQTNINKNKIKKTRQNIYKMLLREVSI